MKVNFIYITPKSSVSSKQYKDEASTEAYDTVCHHGRSDTDHVHQRRRKRGHAKNCCPHDRRDAHFGCFDINHRSFDLLYHRIETKRPHDIMIFLALLVIQ